MAKTPAETTLYSALKATAMVEVVEVTRDTRQLRVLFRVQSQPGQKNNSWPLVLHTILLGEASADWTADVSRKYFLRPVNGVQKLLYIWRMILRFPENGEDATLAALTRLVNAAPRPAITEVTEVALVGAGNYRSGMTNGRGVSESGKGPVGPAAFGRYAGGR